MGLKVFNYHSGELKCFTIYFILYLKKCNYRCLLKVVMVWQSYIFKISAMFPLYVGRTNAIIIITNKPVLSNTYYYVFYMLKIKLDFKFCKSNCVFAFPATQSYRTTILVPRQLVCTWAHAVMSKVTIHFSSH